MVAIVIPYFKHDFFDDCLASLANQTDKRFKVYIGDDNSPIDPLPTINKYSDVLNITYRRFNKNMGAVSLTQQWDRCIALISDEEWLMLLGDDDFLGSNVMERWYEHYSLFEDRTEVIRFSSRLKIEKLKTISKVYKHPIWEEATASFLRKYKGITRSSLTEYIFSYKTYRKHGFYNYPLAWNSDDRAWLDFSENKPIYTINDAIIYIRLSEINISGRLDNIEQKTLSSILFYKHLIQTRLFLFQKKTRLVFLRKYEKETGKLRKTKFREWLFLTYYYTKNFEYNIFKNFVKRWVRSLLK